MRLFAQQLVQPNNKEHIRDPDYWPFVSDESGFPRKEPVKREVFPCYDVCHVLSLRVDLVPLLLAVHVEARFLLGQFVGNRGFPLWLQGFAGKTITLPTEFDALTLKTIALYDVRYFSWA